MYAFAVAHLEIHHAATHEPDDRVARRRLETIHQLPLAIDDVEYRSSRDRTRRREADPEIPVHVRAHGVHRDRRTEARQLLPWNHADLAQLRRLRNAGRVRDR